MLLKQAVQKQKGVWAIPAEVIKEWWVLFANVVFNNRLAKGSYAPSTFTTFGVKSRGFREMNIDLKRWSFDWKLILVATESGSGSEWKL